MKPRREAPPWRPACSPAALASCVGQVVEMLRKGQGVFTLVVISGQQVSSGLKQQAQQQQQMTRW